MMRTPKAHLAGLASIILLCLPGCDLPGSKAGQRPARTEASVGAPIGMAGAPAEDIHQLLADWEELDSHCRGGVGDSPATERACRRREVVDALISAQGWCYGENAAYGSQAEWRECGDPIFPSLAAAEAAAAVE